MLQRRVLRQTGERSDGGMEAAHVARVLSRVRLHLFASSSTQLSLVHRRFPLLSSNLLLLNEARRLGAVW